MNVHEVARDITDTLLGYLGFVVHLEATGSPEAPSFQIFTEETDLLIGRNGERLEDIQYLVNRLVQTRMPNAPRVRIDIAHYRSMKEDQMLDHIRQLADRVRRTGRPVKLPPMNSYQRRLVHNALTDDPDVKTWSPEDESRLKRITLLRRQAAAPRQH
jgi:spoIIIJ-associated protein